MDNIKDDTYYIDRMFTDMAFIVRQMESIDPDAFAENEILQDSMMFRLIQISENARKLSDAYKDRHPAIPWTAIYGLRNRIVHDYGNVEMTIIFDTLKNDIPVLMKNMQEQLRKN